MMRMRPPTVDELVAEWLSGEDCPMSVGLLEPFADPEAVCQAILKIMQCELTSEQIPLLAARPVEDLLAHYGAQFIERIEVEAQRSPAFAHVLGGVWQRNVPSQI